MTNLFETFSPLPAPGCGRFARVVLERGIDARTEGLTYALPESLRDLHVGQRVLVPLGKANKAVAGYVTEMLDASNLPAGKTHLIKTILSRDQADTRLTPDLIVLARWIAGYYCCPLGMVLQNMLPAAVKHGTGSRMRMMVGLAESHKSQVEGHKSPDADQGSAGAGVSGVGSGLPEQSAELSATRDARPETRDAPALGSSPGSPQPQSGGAPSPDSPAPKLPKPRKLSKQQQAVLDAARRLADDGQEWVEIKDLADHAGAATVGPVKQLLARGLLLQRAESSIRPPVAFDAGVEAGDADAPPVVLNDDQQKAVDHLAGRIGQGFGVFLLHGVTGSGKTEVYLRVIERVLGLDGPHAPSPHAFAIVLVPEIALTPQTVRRFTARFADIPGGVAVLHSGLTAAQRHDFWRRIRDDEARIVVGARSAIFAPLPFPNPLSPRERGASRFIGTPGEGVPAPGLTPSPVPTQSGGRDNLGPPDAGGVRASSPAPASAPGPDGAGVIIVDEEHENSYKQDQLPRYHARDVAIKRAQILNVPVILGSATPSLESYYNATVAAGTGIRDEGSGISSGKRPKEPGDKSQVESHKSQVREGDSAAPRDARPETRDPALQSPDRQITKSPNHGAATPGAAPRYHLLRLPQRIGGLRLPHVEIVDMTAERRKRYEYTGSAGVHLLSLRLETAIGRALKAKAQIMLLLNRRGYANYIACPDHRCGWMMTCEYCDVTMVYHRDQSLRTGGLVRCHHCLAEQLLPPVCPVCGRKVTVFGLGTQRVEEELARKFPGVRALRMDSDAMQTARQYHEAFARFRRGEVDVLLGTQMIGKGLDFPNVRLVGVISGDTALHMPDFRAAERTFQMIAQVAGRAGRSAAAGPGVVIVQSFSPADPAIVLAAKHDYEGFAQREIALRQQVGLPPAARMARLVIRDLDHLKCQERAAGLAASLRDFDQQLATAVRIRGPAPCPIARIGGFHRQQIELLAPTPGPIQKLLSALRGQRLVLSDARTAVDVDPVSLM